MKTIAAALLLCVAAPNYGYQALAVWFGSTEGRWQYVLEGAAGVVMFAMLAMLLQGLAPRLICAWGACESALKGGCGALRLYEKEFAPGGMVCQGGEALTMIGVWVALLLALGVCYGTQTARPG